MKLDYTQTKARVGLVYIGNTLELGIMIPSRIRPNSMRYD